MLFNKYYTNSSSYLGKNNYYCDIFPHKPRIKRTYGWDFPFQDYSSNRHYNTHRHIILIHGHGSGEPKDHLTGQTRREKMSSTVQNFNQSSNMSIYPRNPVSAPSANPDLRHTPMGYSPNSVRLLFVEDAERRVKELGYPIPAQSPGPSPYSNGVNFPYSQKKLPFRQY